MHDVIIIGGGVIGSAAAYFLSADPNFDGRVAIVERDTGFADGSTARSVGGIRMQFSTPLNVEMSQFAARFIREAEDLLSVGGDRPVIPFVEQGYLLLASDKGLPVLESNVAVQRELGAATELLESGETARRFPWINADGVAAGAFGPRDEGWTDPYALMQAFRKKAISLGAELIADAVIGLDLDGRRIERVRLAGGDKLSGGHVINAAGPAAAEIAAMAGIDLPVRPRRRYVFVIDCRDDAVADILAGPLTVDPSGVYVRPEGRHFLCGLSPDPGDDPDTTNLDVDYGYFDTQIWARLAFRIPAFEAVRVVNAWAGVYAYNTLDQNALLGAHSAVENLLFANGFSGHGLQQSPAVGRGLAELVVYGAYRSLDLSALSVGRIISGDAVIEANVV